MQMIEVSMRDENQIDRRKIGNAQAGTSQAFQNKEPAREVRIDDYVLPAHLHKEAGMPDEGNAEFTVSCQAGLVGLTRAGSNRRVAYQTSKLSGALAEGRIAQRLLNHPAREPGRTRNTFNLMILILVTAVRVTISMRRNLFALC